MAKLFPAVCFWIQNPIGRYLQWQCYLCSLALQSRTICNRYSQPPTRENPKTVIQSTSYTATRLYFYFVQRSFLNILAHYCWCFICVNIWIPTVKPICILTSGDLTWHKSIAKTPNHTKYHESKEEGNFPLLTFTEHLLWVRHCVNCFPVLAHLLNNSLENQKTTWEVAFPEPQNNLFYLRNI